MRGHFAHPAERVNGRIVAQCDADLGVGRYLAHQAGRDVEHRVGAVVVRDGYDHLAGPHHLAGLGAGRDYHALRIRPQFRIAELVFGRVQLGRRRIDVGFGGAIRLLGGIELNLGGPTLAQQRLLALQIPAGFIEDCLGCDMPGLRGVQGVLLRLRIKFGDKVAWFDDLPDIDPARDHLAVDAKGEALLSTCPDVACE